MVVIMDFMDEELFFIEEKIMEYGVEFIIGIGR